MTKKPSKPIGDRLAEQKLRNDLAAEKLRASLLKARAEAAGRAMKVAGNRASIGFRTPMPGLSDRYESARRTRIRKGSISGGGSGDRYLTESVRSQMSRDAQDLRCDESAARIVVNRCRELIVGDGPTVTSGSKEADELWRMFFEAEDPDYTGHIDIRGQRDGAEIFAGFVDAWCTDGDQAVVLTDRGSLQCVEAERVVTPIKAAGGAPMGRLPNGHRIVDGVEMDAAGTPVAYHVAEWDVYGNLDRTRTRRIAADFCALVVSPFGLRTGFTRGEPALQAVAGRIERLGSYETSTAIAAEVATLFAAVIESSDPAGMQMGHEDQADSQPSNPNPNAAREVPIQPGAFQYIEKGGSVKQLDPKHPTTNFRDYVVWQLMMIGAELGVPIVASMYDSTGLSWSNIKAILSLSMRSIEPAQMRLARVLRWMRAWKIRQWQDEGLLTLKSDQEVTAALRCTVQFPRAPVVDFKSEVEGYVEAINARLMTRRQAVEMLGLGDFGKNVVELGQERRALIAAGVPEVMAPGTAGGQAPAPDGPNATPDHPGDLQGSASTGGSGA